MKAKELKKPHPDSVRFLKYITTDGNGTVTGIQDDAPEWAKKQFKEYDDKYKYYLSKGILI